MKKKSEYNIEGRIWISRDDVHILGDGKIELLKRIRELGSLSRAATSMKMSYKKAWNSIQKMNSIEGKELVILSRGGSEGGNAKLTAFAEHILEQHEKLSFAFDTFLKEQLNLWNSSIEAFSH